jgi:hypothetical protein
MNSILIEFYFLMAVIILMIAYAGFEGTMRVFVYLELQIKYAYVRIQMWQMRRNLRSTLKVQTEEFLKEYDAKRKNHQD